MTIKIESIKLNYAGFRALRKCAEAQQWVDETAKRIADACGDGYVAEDQPGRNRARAIVRPDTTEARIDSLQDLTMIRNMRA